MKTLILPLLLALTTSTTFAAIPSECKRMEYSVKTPAMKTYAENNAYQLTVESDVKKMLQLRGYTPIASREVRHHYDVDTYCLLQVNVKEWPRFMGSADEVSTSVKIYRFETGTGIPLFTYEGEYGQALPAIPKSAK